MSKYKVGDKVKILNLNISGGDKEYVGHFATIDSLAREDCYNINIENGPGFRYSVTDGEIELATKLKNNMSIKESFALALTPEPQKTFRRLGITNGDNLLTDEGSTIFLTWLLGKNQDAFKKEVCDPMLAEQDKK